MSENAERLDRVFKALGALEAGLHAIERAKVDRADAGAIAAQVEALHRDKADRVDMLHLESRLVQNLREEVADLSDRMGTRMDGLNSQILDIRARLDKIGTVFDSRGIELAKMREGIEDLARAMHEANEAAAREKATRWKIWRVRIWSTMNFSFRLFTGLALIVILMKDGVHNAADLLDAARFALGAP